MRDEPRRATVLEPRKKCYSLGRGLEEGRGWGWGWRWG